ncbi:hypothetical protein WA577_007131, partial [Blastocystis sp. JDR]
MKDHHSYGDIIVKKYIVNSSIEKLMKRFSLLQNCNSKYLLKYNDAQQVENKLCIISEYCDWQPLSFRLGNIPVSNLAFLRLIAFSCLLGLDDLHHFAEVAHGNLKPSNIFLNDNGEVRFCDYGLEDELLRCGVRMTKKQWVYCAPEVFEGK